MTEPHECDWCRNAGAVTDAVRIAAWWSGAPPCVLPAVDIKADVFVFPKETP